MGVAAFNQAEQHTANGSGPAPSMMHLNGQRGKVFHNWAHTFRCSPELYFQPRSVSEIHEIITLALNNRKHLTVVGSGHSPGDITCTDDYMINLDNLCSLLEVRREEGIVRVQAGMRLSQLHKHLDENQLAMPNLGSISDQSIAGFISTGTHGSSMRHSLLSDAVLEIKMILADGSQITCSRSQHHEIFLAALVSLGALGVIYEMTLQVSQAFAIESTQSIYTFPQMIAQWRASQLWQSAEFVRVWWFPYSAHTVVWKGDRVVSDAKSLQPTGSWYRDTFWAYHMQQAFLYFGRFVPSLSPTIERIVFKQHYGTKRGLVSRAVEKSDVALNMNCLFSQYVNEWSVPLEKGPEACERLNAWLNGREKESGIPYSAEGVFVHAPIELRVSAARNDDAWLSTTTGGPVCYIGIIMYKPFYTAIPYRRYFQAYEYLMRSLGGRPHWAKHYNMSQAELRALYPKMDDWLALREKLDPTGLFTNEYHRRHLLATSANGALLEPSDAEGRRFKARL